MAGAWIRRLVDVPPIDVEPEGHDWQPLQHQFRLTAFGANVDAAKRAGAELIMEHDERGSGQEELYVVLSGRVEVVLDGDRAEVDAGAVVAVTDPAVRRSIRGLEPGAAVLAVGGNPGTFVTTWRAEHFRDVPVVNAEEGLAK
jgi:hypothetical protein